LGGGFWAHPLHANTKTVSNADTNEVRIMSLRLLIFWRKPHRHPRARARPAAVVAGDFLEIPGARAEAPF
jgi:hypothetical protein